MGHLSKKAAPGKIETRQHPANITFRTTGLFRHRVFRNRHEISVGFRTELNENIGVSSIQGGGAMVEKAKRAVGYCRISTEGQEAGSSLDDQREKIELLCKTKGYNLVQVYQDIYSGATMLDRKGFTAMMADARKRAFDVLVVQKIDRLGRSLLDILNSIEELTKACGVTLIATDQQIDTSGITGKILITILSLVADLERSFIRQRTMAGRWRKWREGSCNLGSIPYGYKKILDARGKPTGEVEVDPEQAKVYHQVVDLYLRKRCSIVDIAIELNKQGYKSPSALRAKKKPAAIHWAAQAVHHLLTNPAYTGETVYNKIARDIHGRRMVVDQPEAGHKPRRKTRGVPITEQGRQWAIKDQKEWLTKKFPPLIDKKRWHQIQARLKHRRRRPVVPSGYYDNHFLLGGMVFCGECGSMIRKRVRKSAVDGMPRWSYLCARHIMTSKLRSFHDTPKCVLPSIDEALADRRAWDQITKLLTYPDKYAALWLKDVNAEDVGAEKGRLEQQLKELETKIAKGFEYILTVPDGERKAKYLQAQRKLEEQAVLIETALKKITESVEIAANKQAHLSAFKKGGLLQKIGFKDKAKFAAFLDALPFDSKRAIVEGVISPEQGGKIRIGFVKAQDFLDDGELEGMNEDDKVKPLPKQPLAITLDFDIDPQRIEEIILGLDRGELLSADASSLRRPARRCVLPDEGDRTEGDRKAVLGSTGEVASAARSEMYRIAAITSGSGYHRVYGEATNLRRKPLT